MTRKLGQADLGVPLVASDRDKGAGVKASAICGCCSLLQDQVKKYTHLN